MKFSDLASRYRSLLKPKPSRRSRTEPLYRYQGGCDAVWSGLFVEKNGDISPCCESRQFESLRIGNLNEMEFADIWRSEKIEKLREHSRNGYMPCPHCTVDVWRNMRPDKSYRSGPANLQDFHIIQIEPSTFCNGRCYMCPLDETDQTEINYEALIEALKPLNPKLVNLVGGEVFLARNIDSFLSWLYQASDRGRKFALAMISNGAISKSGIDELVQFFSAFDITFLGTTSEIEKAVSGLSLDRKIDFMKSLIQARNEYDYQGREGLKVGMLFTVTPSSFHQIPDVVPLAENLGAERLVFGFDHYVTAFMAQYPALVERVRKDLVKVVGQERELEVHSRALEAMKLL